MSAAGPDLQADDFPKAKQGDGLWTGHDQGRQVILAIMSEDVEVQSWVILDVAAATQAWEALGDLLKGMGGHQ